MATAEELLSGVSTVDKTLIISNDLRTINIPSSVRNLGVESDDDVLQLNFRMPRYIGTIDLSTFSIRINYINSKGDGNIYTVNNPIIDEQFIAFTWLVGPGATMYKGDTKFNVCLRKLNEVDEIDKEYNTTIATLPVLEGLEVDESFIESYVDLLTQWQNDLFSIGPSEITKIRAASAEEQLAIESAGDDERQAIVNKGAEVLATIPTDYTETYRAAQEGVRTKADAIVCEAQGEIITVSDSSDDYLRGVKLFGRTIQNKTTGKNLLKITAIIGPDGVTKNGVKFTVNADGSIKANGTNTDDHKATGNIYFELGTIEFTKGLTYVLSGCPADGSADTYRMYSGNYYDYGSGNEFIAGATESKSVYIQIKSGTEVDNMVFYPMIRLVTVPENTNLLNLTTTSGSDKGVTFTVKADGSITANGTAKNTAYFKVGTVEIKAGKNYIMSGCPSDGSELTYKMYTGNNFDYGDGVTIKTSNDETKTVWIKIEKDTTVSNIVYYPMVCIDSVMEGAFEPYTGGIPAPNPTYPQALNNICSAGSAVAKVMGANMFDVAHATVREGNGLKADINADGSVTVNGTPAGNYAQVFSGTIKLPKGKYFVSGGENAAGCAYFQLYANKTDGSQKYAINGVFEVDGTEIDDIHYSIQSGNNLDPINNYKLYPMFNVGEIQMPFEPYKSGGEMTIQLPNGLPGIPVASGGNYTDVNGQQWICDEVDLGRGVYVQRFKKVSFTGQENWVLDSNYSCTYRVGAGHIAIGGLCSHYPTYFITEDIGLVSGVYLAYTVNHIITDTKFVNDLDGFKAFLSKQYASGNPVTVIRRLNEPNETPLTAEEIEAFKVLHSNKPNTTVFNDSGAHMSLEYNADTKTYIDNRIDAAVKAQLAANYSGQANGGE